MEPLLVVVVPERSHLACCQESKSTRRTHSFRNHALAKISQCVIITTFATRGHVACGTRGGNLVVREIAAVATR